MTQVQFLVRELWSHKPHSVAKKNNNNKVRWLRVVSRDKDVVNRRVKCSLWLPRWLGGKESTCQCRRQRKLGFTPWVRKIPWRRKGNPNQYSCLENPMDWEAWQPIVHGVTKSWTWLSDFHFHTCREANLTAVFYLSSIQKVKENLLCNCNARD